MVVSFRLMESVYRVAASAAVRLRHLAHRHSEAVAVCLGDLQSCAQGVAANPEGEGESAEREDEAGHGSSRLVDAVSLQADGLVTLQAVTVHPLAHAERGTQQHQGDGTTRCLEAVEFGATTEANANAASDGVGGHLADGGAAEGVRFEHGWLRVMVVYRVRGGGTVPPCASSEVGQHFVHLIGIDGDAIPCHTVTSLPEHPPDLTLHHAAHELIPRGLILSTILHTCHSSVVEEIIILNPQGSVPGFVGCPTVVGAEGEVFHVVCLN